MVQYQQRYQKDKRDLATFDFMVKISRVRSAERRRSRSEIGIDIVAEDPRLIEVEAVSRDKRSLEINSLIFGACSSAEVTYPPETLLPRAELLPLLCAASLKRGSFLVGSGGPLTLCDLMSTTTSSSLGNSDGREEGEEPT